MYMLIAKTASTNVAFKAVKLSDSVYFEHQLAVMTREAAEVDLSLDEEKEALEDLDCNVDLCIFGQIAIQDLVSGLVCDELIVVVIRSSMEVRILLATNYLVIHMRIEKDPMVNQGQVVVKRGLHEEGFMQMRCIHFTVQN